MAKKILVLGAQGMLGSVVYRHLQRCNFGEVRGIARKNPYNDPYIHHADINDMESVMAVINQHKPNIIVNCVGLIPQKMNGRDASYYDEVNYLFPRHLLEKINHLDIRLIQMSTDCVFRGKSRGIFKYNMYKPTEAYSSEFVAQDSYGLSKLYFDDECASDCVILRTSIIGPTYKNTGAGLFDFAVKNRAVPYEHGFHQKKVDGYINHFWNGNTTLQVAKIMAQVIREDTPNGLYQLGNEEVVNKSELLGLISDEFNLKLIVLETVTPETVDRTISVSDYFSYPSIREQIKQLRLWTQEEAFPIW